MRLERINVANKFSNKNHAYCDLFLQDVSREIQINKRPIIVIAPGGGYEYTSDREADVIAFEFLSQGMNACVLRYSCASDESYKAAYPAAIMELATTVKYIRDNAEKLGVMSDKIITCGFSAGGHLVATLGNYWNSEWLKELTGFNPEEIKPNAQILCYPVITTGEYAHRGSITHLLGDKANDEKLLERFSLEKNVSQDTPKTFLWHTIVDTAVPIQNSMYFFNACMEKKVSVEYHAFELGRHGLSLANELVCVEENVCKESAVWIDLLRTWLNNFCEEMFADTKK